MFLVLLQYSYVTDMLNIFGYNKLLNKNLGTNLDAMKVTHASSNTQSGTFRKQHSLDIGEQDHWVRYLVQSSCFKRLYCAIYTSVPQIWQIELSLRIWRACWLKPHLTVMHISKFIFRCSQLCITSSWMEII